MELETERKRKWINIWHRAPLRFHHWLRRKYYRHVLILLPKVGHKGWGLLSSGVMRLWNKEALPKTCVIQERKKLTFLSKLGKCWIRGCFYPNQSYFEIYPRLPRKDFRTFHKKCSHWVLYRCFSPIG